MAGLRTDPHRQSRRYLRASTRNDVEMKMEFRDILVRKEDRYSIGIEEQAGKYYLSIPVANNFVDYEEYYEINEDEFHAFNVSAAAAAEFVQQCRIRKQDNRLIIKPGKDRGVAI